MSLLRAFCKLGYFFPIALSEFSNRDPSIAPSQLAHWGCISRKRSPRNRLPTLPMPCLSRKLVNPPQVITALGPNPTSSESLTDKRIISVIESAVVLMVSCTSAIHVFWTKYAGFLRSRFGLLIPSYTKSKLSESTTNLGATSTSNSDHTEVRAHEYVELDGLADTGKPPYERKVLKDQQYV